MEELHIQNPYISCPKVRISDILLLNEDEDEEHLYDAAAFDMSCLRCKKHEEEEEEEEEEVELEQKLEWSSPRKTISGWMKSMVEKKKKKKKKVGKWRATVERECVVVDLDRRMGVACDGCDSSSTMASGLDESGNRGRESMLNLGVACSLLYIIAASKNELNRMTELHREMDMTLQKMRAITQRKDSLDELSESKDGASSCVTDVKEAWSCSSQNSRQSCPFSEQETLIACESVKHYKSKQETTEGLEELEAELEAELERLQLQLDGEGFPKYSQHRSAKMMVEDAALSSSSASMGEVTDPREVPAEFQCGVPPVELERKLHELLESRQQEQIEELKAALRRAERKLREKEKEISWWKDTALIISQHTV